jgi:predicted amidohydrolase YtcJ
MILLSNARIRTLDPTRPTASVLAVNGGRVLAAGGDELLAEFDGLEPHDLGGRTVLPGLNDAHIHLQQYALSLQVIDCEARTLDEVVGRLAERAARTRPGEWLRGHGWQQEAWGGDWPSAADLDAAAPHHPVYLTSKSLHAAWVNSRGLELAGISASTPDPVGGRIQRGPDGTPSGILLESAVRLVERAIPEIEPETLAGQLRQVIPGLMRLGLTGIHDFDGRTCFQALQVLHGRGELSLRVVKSVPAGLLPQAAGLGLRSGFGDDLLRIGSVKLFADGALGPRTAAMLDPYVDEPENRGILVLDAEHVFEQGCLAAQSGLSLAVHAIGDRAVREVLDGFERLRAFERERGLPALRHRMEHVQTVHPEDAGRLAELGVIASMQPVHAPSDRAMAERWLGGRTTLSYAWRTQLDQGARLAFGSDAPVESPNPFLGLHAAVTRRGADGSPGPQGWHPAQRLSVAEALEGFVSGPAYAAGTEDRLGRLSPGYLADLIVVDADPFTCEPARLAEIRPEAAMLGGKWVWQ